MKTGEIYIYYTYTTSRSSFSIRKITKVKIDENEETVYFHSTLVDLILKRIKSINKDNRRSIWAWEKENPKRVKDSESELRKIIKLVFK